MLSSLAGVQKRLNRVLYQFAFQFQVNLVLDIEQPAQVVVHIRATDRAQFALNTRLRSLCQRHAREPFFTQPTGEAVASEYLLAQAFSAHPCFCSTTICSSVIVGESSSGLLEGLLRRGIRLFGMLR